MKFLAILRDSVREAFDSKVLYALVILSEGSMWAGGELGEYGAPDAYGHRKKMSVAEMLGEEIRTRLGEETGRDRTARSRADDGHLGPEALVRHARSSARVSPPRASRCWSC